ncbi:MAG TPA: ubiquinone/menaquinone biosynthesis methyltransferase [Verrucomicrobiae bacterium]|jgi:demethylmenaquinone methyltransferase/2-methoxy-6-polyprenyl-1,4-benzoquinol methylase
MPKLRPNDVSNKYYKTGAERASLVESLFGVLAPRYDLINDLQSMGLHRHWKKLTARMAEVKPGQNALDLCCGTGDIAFALQRAGAEVTGLDFSPAMLAVAQRRAQKCPAPPSAPPLRFMTGDVMEIPFKDASFDIVTIGYGLRNLASWERGLEEMARVARPGGRLLALDFGKPEAWLWRRLFFFYLSTVVPLLGNILCRNAAALAYIRESLEAYPAQRGVAEKMASLGCRDVKVRNLLGGAMSIHSAVRAQ